MTQPEPVHISPIAVPSSATGLRLDVFLGQSQLPYSRSRLQQWIDRGAIKLDNACVSPAKKLRAGQLITIDIPQAIPATLQPVPMNLSILYEDADFLVLNKAAGISVHPGAGPDIATLVHGLLAHCHDLSGIGGVLRPGIVHRLDKGTSGVLLVAKHDQAHLALSQQFAERRVHKIYTALVVGVPKQTQAHIETYYARHPTHRQRFTGRCQQGKIARTSYRILAHNQTTAMLELILHTGRTHQIRVHMAEAGHPLVGDTLYGTSKQQSMQYQALHATALHICHPRLGHPMVFCAPLPNWYEVWHAAPGIIHKGDM